MSETTIGGRIERIIVRVALVALGTYAGYLQTGQLSLEGGETSRDTDTVAVLKVVHRLELRIQRLEDVGHPELGPLAPEPDVPVPAALAEEEIDIKRILGAIRSMVSKEEVETYQQAR
jgi:ornithine carbamoyltransferase